MRRIQILVWLRDGAEVGRLDGLIRETDLVRTLADLGGEEAR